MIRINLLPPEFAAERAKREQQIVLGAGLGILLFFMVIFWGL